GAPRPVRRVAERAEAGFAAVRLEDRGEQVAERPVAAGLDRVHEAVADEVVDEEAGAGAEDDRPPHAERLPDERAGELGGAGELAGGGADGRLRDDVVA